MTAPRSIAAIAWLVAALALGCDAAPGKPDRADAYVRPADVTSFETLYATNCSGCHGADGTHGAAMPIADPVYLAWAPRSAIRDAAARGVDGTPMPAFARSEGGWLTDAQLDVLVDGLATGFASTHASETIAADPDAKEDGGLPPYRQPAGDPDRGAAAWGRFCARCHGETGQGGEGGSDVVAADYLALVSDQALRAAVVVGRPDLGMPGWREVGDAPMTARQVDDVVAWLAARRPRSHAARPR